MDSWSFGCVLVLCATWVVLGGQGILQFMKFRVAAQGLEGTYSDRRTTALEVSDPQSTTSDKPLEMDDCFHNNEKLLPLIGDWISHLKNESRRCDPFTSRVLFLVENELLLEDAEERSSFEELCESWKKASEMAIREYEGVGNSLLHLHHVDDRVHDILIAIEMAAREIPEHPSLVIGEYTKVKVRSREILVPLGLVRDSKRLYKTERISRATIKLTPSRIEASEKVGVPGPEFVDGIETRRKFSVGSSRISHSSSRFSAIKEYNEGQEYTARLSPRLTYRRSPWSSSILTNSPERSPTSSPALAPTIMRNDPQLLILNASIPAIEPRNGRTSNEPSLGQGEIMPTILEKKLSKLENDTLGSLTILQMHLLRALFIRNTAMNNADREETIIFALLTSKQMISKLLIGLQAFLAAMMIRLEFQSPLLPA
jgi:hypothetical protein